MNRRALIGILLALIGVGLAVFGILVIGRLLTSSLQPAAAVVTQAPAVTEKVVVARRDLTIGSVLAAEDLQIVDVPVEVAPRNALASVEPAVGRMIKVPLVAGELVMSHHLADPTNVQHDLAFVLRDDQVLMAFPAGDLLSNLNLLQRGDLVDVLVSITEPVSPEDVSLFTSSGEEDQGEERLFTFDALQRVEISAVVVDIIDEGGGGGATGTGAIPGTEATPQPTPTPSRSQVRTQAILLALAPQDALTLKHLKDAGAVVDIVLRSPTSNQVFELDPVMPEYLIDRYGLQVKR